MSMDEQMPIACTLDLQAMAPRLAEIGKLTREHLRSHRLDGRTLRLTYDAAAAQEVSRIVGLERLCCTFLDFELEVTVDAVALSITAPGQDGTDVRWLFAQFLPATEQPDTPPSRASDCACCRG